MSKHICLKNYIYQTLKLFTKQELYVYWTPVEFWAVHRTFVFVWLKNWHNLPQIKNEPGEVFLKIYALFEQSLLTLTSNS